MEKILFVDDNVELCALVRPFLKIAGIELNYSRHAKIWSLKMTSAPVSSPIPPASD